MKQQEKKVRRKVFKRIIGGHFYLFIIHSTVWASVVNLVLSSSPASIELDREGERFAQNGFCSLDI